MKVTGWEGTDELIVELHRLGLNNTDLAATAAAQAQPETLIDRIHAAGPNKLAPKCIACLGKTAACGAACQDDSGCPFNTGNTIRKIDAALHTLLDREWEQKVLGKDKSTSIRRL